MFMLVIWLMQAVVIDEYNTVPPKKNVGEGTVKYDTFFSNCEKVPDVGCLISPFGFFLVYISFVPVVYLPTN